MKHARNNNDMYLISFYCMYVGVFIVSRINVQPFKVFPHDEEI